MNPRGACPPSLRAAAIGALAIAVLFTLPAFASAHASASFPPAPNARGLGGGVSDVVPGHFAPNTAAPVIRSSGVTRGGPAGPTGAGKFFSTTTLPYVTPGNQSCYRVKPGAGGCDALNVSTSPVLNLTSHGVFALAYTAFTNASPCGGLHRAYTDTLVGVSTSANGTAWSAPQFLGNPLCDASNATNFTSAWQPTLTSLANGTLVLAYVEYNLSSGFPPDLWGYHECSAPTSCSDSTDVRSSQLVVSRSFDGGAHWTTPLAVNSSIVAKPATGESWLPYRPSVVAWGKTVYLAWENLSGYPGYGLYSSTTSVYGSAQVHLIVSTDGGASFGARIDLPIKRTSTQGAFAMNPSLATLPNGTVELAYATNLSYGAASCCDGFTYTTYHLDVVVATSYANGSAFSVRTVASDLPIYLGIDNPHPHWGYQLDPAPQLAVAPGGSQLYATWASLDPAKTCRAGLTGPVSCGNNYNLSQVYFANESLPSGRWTYGVVGAIADIGNEFALNVTTPVPSQHFEPAIAVDGQGTIDLQAVVLNGSICGTYFLSGSKFVTCGSLVEVTTSSTNHGASWSAPTDVRWEPTLWAQDPPDGPSSAILAAGGSVYLAWTETSCPTWNASGSGAQFSDCLWGYKPFGASTTIEVSTPFHGTGITLTFTETGLFSGTTWSADLLGNLRVGTSASLSVSGVPANAWMYWTVSAGSGYGIQATFVTSPPPPARFSASRIIAETATVRYLVTIASDPSYAQASGSSCASGTIYWDNKECPYTNYAISPGVESVWETPGTVIPIAVTPQALFCSVTYCYWYATNLSFLAWSGVGAGSASTTANASSITVAGPINETADFQFLGWCQDYWYSYGTTLSWYQHCLYTNSSLTFEEEGLPYGTAWGVSTWSSLTPSALPSENFSYTPFVTVGGSSLGGFTSYAPWTILPPRGSSNTTEWVGVGTPVSPVLSWSEGLVLVNYSEIAGPPPTASLLVQAVGLYSNTSWAYALDNGTPTGLSEGGSRTTVSVGSHSIAGLPVYFANGTGFRATSIDYQPFAFSGGGWQNASRSSATVDVASGGLARVGYAPTAELTTEATTGGTVSPAPGWYVLGSRVPLSETPLTGYHFLGWTGSGAGAVTSSIPAVNATIAGPITELATFVHDGPTTATVTVEPVGLPLGESFSVEFNGSSYAAAGNLTLPAVLPGDYTFSVPYAYANASALERFVPTSVQSSIPAGPGGTYDITVNGTITVSFTTQYLLTVAASGPGSVTPAPGEYWEDAGTAVVLTSTAQAGYVLSAWAGTGTGSASGPTGAVTVHADAPISETALFVLAPPVGPATYRLNVSESGLPIGVAWGFAVGATGASGTAANLSVGGLNGSYVVTVPTVYGAAGERWVPTPQGAYSSPLTVGSDQSLAVVFTLQYFVAVTGGSDGSVSPGSAWWDVDSSVTIHATPLNTSVRFVGWAGDVYSGGNATTAFTVTGPVNESAEFAPIEHPRTVGSSTAGESIAWTVLLALLVVGVALGLVVGQIRRRRPPAEEAVEPSGDDGGPFPPEPVGPDPFEPEPEPEDPIFPEEPDLPDLP